MDNTATGPYRPKTSIIYSGGSVDSSGQTWYWWDRVQLGYPDTQDRRLEAEISAGRHNLVARR